MNISLYQLFRLTFVVFSLYLLGDAFYRWDGFSYYASFFEFIPSVALALILWSIVSAFTAIVLWVLFKLCKWFCALIGIEIEIEHLLSYSCTLVLSVVLAWKCKKLIWPDVQTTVHVKTAVFVGTAFLSLFVTWLARHRANRVVVTVFERVTPLVWLFGISVIFSILLVSYHTWVKVTYSAISQNNTLNVSEDITRPNIILVTFDALAAHNMSAYGYHKETTPFISKWSKNATVFNMAEAASNFTTPAAASLMTGKRVWTHRTFHIAGTRPVKSNVESLPSVLKENGYFNIALVVNPFASVNSLGMSDSFDIAPPASEFGTPASFFGWKFGVADKMLFHVFGEKIRMHNWNLRNDFILSKVINLISRNITETTVPPDKAFNKFLNIIDDYSPKPYFAWIHIFPPHDPYLPPKSFQDPLNNSPELRSYKRQENIIEKSYEYLFAFQSVPDNLVKEIELMRAYYDEYIGYVDKSYENFIRELDNRKTENTLIVLTADHGESFEHGYFTHGGPFLYEQVTHIPLIIKVPGQRKGRFIENLVEQIDIPATVLGLANIPVPSWMEGRSLVPLMSGETPPQRPAFSMNFEGNRSRGHKITEGTIAVWDDNYKLIHYLTRGESLLFNLKRDPGEFNNLYDKEPRISQRLLALIKENINKANKISERRNDR